MSERGDAGPVTAYKAILRRVLDARPSGTRLKLAEALGKNRSFVSQITNPAYPVPIPAQHVETIFEVCHVSREDREAFLEAYHAAHPGRARATGPVPMRLVSFKVPDLGDASRNQALDRMIADFVARLSRFAEELG